MNTGTDFCLVQGFIHHICQNNNVFILVEGEAQAALHRPTAVGAVGDAAAKPLPLGPVEAGSAVGDPAGQVSGHAGPVKGLCDLSLADSLTVVTLFVVELLQDGVHLEPEAEGLCCAAFTGFIQLHNTEEHADLLPAARHSERRRDPSVHQHSI